MALRRLPRIERLDLATLMLPDWYPESIVGLADVYGYVVDHPDGPIVFDTGIGAGNEFIDEVYAPECVSLDRSLEAVGVPTGSVVAVVNSHLHFDHCGQNPTFYGSDAPVFVQRSELETVERDEYYTDASWATPPIVQQRLLDGDLAIAEGVTILATPGHTTGHQSVLVESDEGRVVLAGQAVWNVREFVNEEATDANVDSPELRSAAVDSIRRIKALDPQVVHFSHCAEFRRSEAPSRRT